MVKITLLVTMVMMATIFFVGSIYAGGLDACSLPKDAGMCRARIPKFFFNTATKQCEQFDWGGCGGNLNQFGDKEQCEAACAK